MANADLYLPDWRSLAQHRTPQWLRDGKFGIYTHWGIYSVPACGPNGSWYPFHMYRPGNPQFEHHEKTYGGAAKFGYKDFLARFTGEKFDPEQWADLFRRAGAKFAGPVGEHHDGFCLWDTRLTPWNAVALGPRRNVVGELEKSLRRAGMKFMVALHHAENWWFFPHWRKDCDTADPRYAGLYGELHDQDATSDTVRQAPASRRFLDTWLAKVHEVIDGYRPDLLWFDFGLRDIPESYKREFLAYYYNQAAAWGREVAVAYKYHDLPPNVALVDLELGREDTLTYHEWITDSTIDTGEAWGFVSAADYKSAACLVHYLADNVSKNGYLLLNVGPRPDGTIPEPAQAALEGLGRWLELNGEAIYGTTPWFTHGEGPTKLAKSGAFGEKQLPQYTAEDVRFTAKGDVLYAICLAWPGREVRLASLGRLRPEEVRSVAMLGDGRPLEWKLTPEAMTVLLPEAKPCEHAYVLKIARKELGA